MRSPRVFVDSSVIIAALLSASGGSSFVLSRYSDRCIFVVNQFALAEIQEILKTKFADRPEMQESLFLLVGAAQIHILADPSQKQVREAAKIIFKNDAPILASALAHADYLLTLDKEFAQAVPETYALTVYTPGDLITHLGS